jgi:hypothetical protein
VSTAAIAFLTFLGGSAVGAIGAAGVTAWHNSTERLRDRMIAAAEAFLVAVEEAHAALWAEQESAHELFEANVEMSALAVRVQEVAGPAERAAPNPSRMPNALASHDRALLMIQRLTEATAGQHNALDTGRRAEVVLALEAAEEAVRRAEDDLVDTPLAALAPLLRESLRNQSRAVTALQGRGDKTRVLIACVHRVHGAVARVVLSFPAIGSISEVADHAEVVKGLFIDAAKAVNQAMMSEADPFSDAETARLVRELTTAREEFARAANLEIGKRRWPWKKYGQ